MISFYSLTEEANKLYDSICFNEGFLGSFLKCAEKETLSNSWNGTDVISVRMNLNWRQLSHGRSDRSCHD